MTAQHEGWESRTLAEVCLPITKSDPAEIGRSTVRYIDIGSVDGASHSLVDVTTIAAVDAPSRCRQIVQSGDTVFSTVRPYLEKIAYVDDTLDDQFASTGFAVLRPGPSVLPKYLYYFCISAVMLDQVLPFQKGVSYPAVLDKEVRASLIPVPSLGEQSHIVDVLEGHLSRLDAGSAYLQASVLRVHAWRNALHDRLVWGSGASCRTVGELLREPMRNGKSGRAAEPGTAGVRTLTLTAVTRDRFEDEFTKVTNTSIDSARNLWLEPGDIFVQRSNTAELVGTAARYDGPRQWAIFPDLLIRVRADESVVDSRYLIAALRAERTHRALRVKAKGLAGSMPKIDQTAISETEIPVPDLAVQRRIADQLEAVSSTARALELDLFRQQVRTRSLRRSLLVAAFCGRLTQSANERGREDAHV